MAKKDSTTTPASFEAAVTELESILGNMERNDLPLEDALTAYQRGVTLIQRCQGTLAAAEQKVQVLEQGLLKDLTTSDNGHES